VGHVAVTLNGRTYKLDCDPGEEQRFVALAGHVKHHMDALTAKFGKVGDERLLLLAALTIADELFEARDALALTESASAATDRRPPRKAGA
jgi:cell division protein ZapA